MGAKSNPWRPSVRKSVMRDWRPAFLALFGRFAGDDWTPPAQVRVITNAAGSRLSWVARFRKPDGQVITLTTRMAIAKDGEWDVVEEKMALHLVTRAAPL